MENREVRTLRLIVDTLRPDPSVIAEAAAILRGGGLVAFATETVYGLGANALDPAAVGRIFEAKARPAWDPLIVHITDYDSLHTVVLSIPEPARLWAAAYWPGPLTLLLPRTPAVPDAVTAGRARVGVRMPAHSAARALLIAAGVPIAAPSANRFGHVSPTTAEHVLADLDGRIDAVLDAGPCGHGLESTVVDPCENPCVMYRPGAVTLEQLRAVWPRTIPHTPADAGTHPSALPSPGVGLRHYAPRARLLLFEGAAELRQALAGAPFGTGVLAPAGLLSSSDIPARIRVQPWGVWGDADTLGRELFASLRALDAAGVERIYCPLPDGTGLEAALRDRLMKAARTE